MPKGGKPPTELVIKDIEEGTGPEAKAGDTVAVQYVGVLFKDGKQFDASWDRGEPFEFALGQGMVIPGWDQGVEGMKVGGRRVLMIPPDLAYGATGAAGDRPERDARLRRRPRRRSIAVVGLAGGEHRADQGGQQQSVQRLAIHVAVLDPVQARAVHEAEPAAHGRAQDAVRAARRAQPVRGSA